MNIRKNATAPEYDSIEVIKKGIGMTDPFRFAERGLLI